MIKINEQVDMDELINPSSEWSAKKIVVTQINGLKWEGRITLVKNPGGDRETFVWFAKYGVYQAWKISGEGAKIGKTRVPDIETFPFSLDVSVNSGIKCILIAWIEKQRSTPPVLTDAAVSSGAVTNGHHENSRSGGNGAADTAVRVTVSAVKTAPPPAAPKPPQREVVPVRSVVPAAPTALARSVTPAPGLPPGVFVVGAETARVVIPDLSPGLQPLAIPASVGAEFLDAGQAMIVLTSECIAFQPNTDDPSFSGQPRKNFDEAELKKLGDGMKEHGQQEYLCVIAIEGFPGKKWEIVDGERRFRAAQLVGIQYLKVLVRKKIDKQRQHLAALILNFNRVGHTPLELSNALQEQVDAGLSIKQLAHAIGKSAITVGGLLSLQHMHAELRPLLDPPTPKKDRIPIMHGKALARIQPEKQVGIWDQARRQPTKALAFAKLNELGKPFFMNVRKKGSRSDPHEIAVRIDRRVNRIDVTLTELNMVSPEEWASFAESLGPEKVAAIAERLAKFGNTLEGVSNQLKQGVE